MPVNLSQYRGSVGIFSNSNLFAQSRVSRFTYLSGKNNNNNNDNNNNNIASGPLILLNKVGLVLSLLNVMFVFKSNGSKHKKSSSFGPLFSRFVLCNLHGWLYILLITFSRDVELNPGPKRNAAHTLSTCHWNLNSICAHNFAKLYFLRAYVSVHKLDIICLSETS